MSDVILKIENLSKQYRLGTIGTGTISHDLNRWFHKVRGKEDPYLKIGESNDRATKGTSEYVWALKDINFEVKKGEVLGIIGKNGAGKSTLLKILSKVTGPTTGSIKSRGRIASLLEVGTGFHPEMTGRENIFLNGAILGMTKKEINAKLEEIIEFSGCQRYIDTPVKRYSSGMTVRLAFAVAAFLEPDILVIDEVLAVGDAEFQKKAIGKMQDISTGDGRTVLFVSHNMVAVRNLCSRSIVLKNGNIAYEGSTSNALDFYLSENDNQVNKAQINYSNDIIGNDDVQLIDVELSDNNGKFRTLYSQSEEITITINFNVNTVVKGMRFNIKLKTVTGEVAFMTSSHNVTKNEIIKGKYTLELKIPPFLLNNLRYAIVLNAGIPGVNAIIKPMDITFIDIEGEGTGGSLFVEKWQGVVSPKIDWKLK